MTAGCLLAAEEAVFRSQIVCHELCRTSVAFWVVAVLWAPLGSVELVVRPGLLASGFLEYATCILWQWLLVVVAATAINPVAHMWKSH